MSKAHFLMLLKWESLFGHGGRKPSQRMRGHYMEQSALGVLLVSRKDFAPPGKLGVEAFASLRSSQSIHSATAAGF